MIAPYDITYPYTVSVTTIKSVVSRFNIVFFIPENDYSNSFRIFLVLIFNIHCFSFTKKRWVPQVSQLPDDLQFSNTRHISGSRSIFEPLYGYFRRNRRRKDHRKKNEDLKIKAKI